MNELLELCGSDDLSFDALQEIINLLGSRVSSQSLLCFHRACYNKKVTLEIVQLLYNTLPGAFRLRDDDGRFSIHMLCLNKYLDETISLDILRFMLEIDPNLPRETNNIGYLPVHLAVKYKSTTFCKILIDAYPQSLRIVSMGGILPIHYACANGYRDDTSDTIKYMLGLDSELLHAEDIGGLLPIHWAAKCGMTKSIELLLKFDPNAASKEINDGSRRLPLHLVCGGYNPNLSQAQLLYDAYPEAILISDEVGDTPADNARSEGNTIIVDFLETQLVYARQANEDMTAMTTVDENSQLPLHRALKENATFGSIKLLVKGNPSALRVLDNSYALPLHIACQFSSVKVVNYLVELAGDILNYVDANEDSPLHYACRGGSLNVVKHLLESNVPSVSERNNKNKLAIHLLLECGENILDRESMEYVETVYQLLLANPEVVRDFMSYGLQQECKKRRFV